MDNIDNSFASETSDRSPEKITGNFLCSEIEQCGFNGWEHHEMNWIEDKEEQAERSNDQQHPEVPNSSSQPQSPRNSAGNDELGTNSDQSSVSDPKTITLIEDTIFSKETGSVSSKVSQYSTSITSQSYSSFLHMKETVYDLHHRNYEELYKKISEKFEQRFSEFEDMYITLFRVKYEQESTYSWMESSPLSLGKNEAASSVYINCTSVIGQMEKATKYESHKRGEYIQKLLELYEEIKHTFSEFKHQVQKKKKQISYLHNRLKDLEDELSYFMLPKQSSSSFTPSVKEKFYGNRYVISKYMIKREESFLETLKFFTIQVISFINLICREVEPKLSVTLKNALISFVEANYSFIPKVEETYQSEMETLTKLNCFESIYEEMAQIVVESIPKTLLSSTVSYGREINSDQYLEGVIQKLNMDAQTFIYLPCVEEDDQNFVYSSQGKARVRWRRILEHHKVEQMDINVIITKEYHMILEAEEDSQRDKIATLKLGDIKLSRKENKLILTDKGKSMLDILLSHRILGQLIFEPSSAIDEIVQEIKQLKLDKKEKNIKNT